METFTFIVEFKDGRQQKINGVKDYLLTNVAGNPLLKVTKGERCIFFNWDEVRYCGRWCDLG